ncbi:hypothetical protein NF419_04875 [Streptococcus suis]|nr:hypothetical protein [Streptococcus suis]MCQ8265251.1 hypothetical protein [Streptococcus suis]HEL9645011.1 hypothetical protein [Streptococcus suis]
MKTIQKNIMKILGGIALIIALNGCTLADEYNQWATEQPASSETGAPRTAEEAAVEAQFEPLFEFLAAEKKDFSNVTRYNSDFVIYNDRDSTDISVPVYEDYAVGFYSLLDTNEGIYSVTKENKTEEIAISLDKSTGEILSNGTELHPYATMPVIDLTILKEFPVDGVRADHPETELTSISYDIDDNFVLLKELKDYLELETIEDPMLMLHKQGNEYSFTLSFSSGEFGYGVSTFIKLK